MILMSILALISVAAVMVGFWVATKGATRQRRTHGYTTIFIGVIFGCVSSMLLNHLMNQVN